MFLEIIKSSVRLSKIVDQKNNVNKMTSALVPFTFNSIKLFTVTINGKHWSRAKEICKALEYKKTTKTGDVIRSKL